VLHEFGRRRGIGLRRWVLLWPAAGACFGLITTAAAQTENIGLITTPSAAAEAVPELRASRRPATATRLRMYADMKRGWHTPPTDTPGLTPEGRTLLVMEVLNTEERIELAPVRDDGGWTEDDLERASHALRDPRNNQEKPIEPRVLDLAYRVQVHFQAKALRIISAFRRGVSKHGKGRAIDIVVPGTRDDEVARFARSLGFVGVGLYPHSGFVHLDTRPRSYFWVDPSGPGQKSRIVQVYGKVGEEADARALGRGETPPSFPGEAPFEGTSGGDDAEASLKGSDDSARAKTSDESTTKGRPR
jgi:uncharacterized protein YcbK (DUF882 family)